MINFIIVFKVKFFVPKNLSTETVYIIWKFIKNSLYFSTLFFKYFLNIRAFKVAISEEILCPSSIIECVDSCNQNFFLFQKFTEATYMKSIKLKKDYAMSY